VKKQISYLIVFLGMVSSNVFATTFTWDNSAPIASGQTIGVGDDLVLTVDQTITISGDVQISCMGGVVKVGASAGTGSVTIKPDDAADYAQLTFSTWAENGPTDIYVWNDLFFTGNDTGSKKMYVSFLGEGVVHFRLPSGRTLSFGGTSTVGTHVRHVMMGYGGPGVMTTYFEKWSYDTDETNTDLSQHSFIKVGKNSVLEYVSPYRRGIAVTTAGEEDNYTGKFYFDPSNKGSGRLILDIAAGDTPGDFKDGAVNLYGSFVEGSGWSGIYDVVESDLRTSVSHNVRAGVGAYFRVTNEVALEHYQNNTVDGETYPTNWATFQSNSANRQGLVVINRNQSLPRFANNYDQVTTLTNSMWYQANTYQTGFVLGNNGIIEIMHNCFLDYIAGSKNTTITDGTHTQAGATVSSSDTHYQTKVKKHNPAALIVDGYEFTYANDSTFTYSASSMAQIKLHGHAGVFARVGAASSSGKLLNETITYSGVLSSAATGSYVAGVIGKGNYDAVSVPVLVAGTTTLTSDQSAEPEGEHAIDIEGVLKILSVDSPEGYTRDGYLNIPTILIDHRGNELVFQNSTTLTTVARPLPTAATNEYYRYNTSSILVNDKIELYDVTLIHNDVSRDLSFLPVSSSLAHPAIVGGELFSLKISKRLSVDPSAVILDYTGPGIFLYNSKIKCHESLVSAGVRWLVREKPITLANGETWTYAHNTSKIVFYNRGNEYDYGTTGYGRVFQLGSRANVMADGTTYQPFSINGVKPNSSLRDSFIDVFRAEPSPDSNISGSQNTIKLVLETAHESGVNTKENSEHIICLSNKSQINLGWAIGEHESTPSDTMTNVAVLVDKRYFPFEYSQALLDAELTVTTSVDNLFSPYTQGVGTLELGGQAIYFGAAGRHDAYGDLSPANNELPPRSVSSDSGGILYVDYGGAFTVSGTYDVIINTVIARRISSVAAASGTVTLTTDQIIMGRDGKIQNYGFNKTLNAQPLLLDGAEMPSMLIHVPDISRPDDFSSVK